MCKCIEQFNKQMAEHNTRIVIPFMVNMDTGEKSRPDQPLVTTEKIDSSKRGSAKKVMASFCPFCGEKYGESND